MIYSLSICNTSAVLNIIYIVKIVLTIISIAAPITLILSCMISGIRAIIDKETDIGKIMNNWSKKMIAALLIFFIPNFVFFIGRLVTGDTSVKNCYYSATLSRVRSLRATEKAQAQARLTAWRQEQERRQREEEERRRREREEREREREERLRQRQQEQTHTGEDDSCSRSYPVYSYTHAKMSVSSYKPEKIDVTDLSCNILKKTTVTINVEIKKEFHSLLEKSCNYVNSSPYLSELKVGTYRSSFESYHGKGLAADINDQYKYKGHMPYKTMGCDRYKAYEKFICEECGGKEDCDKNVNYQLYMKVFKPAGWCWGGFWNVESFDPMHFERTIGTVCYYAPPSRIKCNNTSSDSKSDSSGDSGSGSSDDSKSGSSGATSR